MAADATRNDLIKIKVGSILNLKEILGQRELDLFMPRGSTLKELIASMIDTFGERLSSSIYSPDSQEVLPHIRMMVNGRDIGFLSGMGTVLQEGDEVLILPMVAGG
jgi:molybdopterin converting factor small subunit